MAPKVPIRSLGTLQPQYPGLQTEQLADRLITAPPVRPPASGRL